MKKKMDDMTKAKLIYSGELLLFGVAFLVVAILKMTGAIPPNETRQLVFNWITLFGAAWIIADLLWALFDKKRQKRIALIDKIIHVPAGIYLIIFDLYCLIGHPSNPQVFQFGMPIALSYLCLCYIFEAFYHYKYPVPGLLDAMKEDKKIEDSSLEESEENKNE